MIESDNKNNQYVAQQNNNISHFNYTNDKNENDGKNSQNDNCGKNNDKNLDKK